MITGWMVDMALLSRTVVSLGRRFEGGELIGKTTLPDDLQHRLPPTTSRSTPKRGHATPADQPLQDGGASHIRSETPVIPGSQEVAGASNSLRRSRRSYRARTSRDRFWTQRS